MVNAALRRYLRNDSEMNDLNEEKKFDQSKTILFAHRGGRGDAPENTLAAFSLAISKGVDGIESDVWLSSDGIPILSHNNAVGILGRRKKISKTPISQLPKEVPSFENFYENFGSNLEVSLDIKDPEAIDATISVATKYGAINKLWICYPDWEISKQWRKINPDFKLVDSPGKKGFPEGGERRAFSLSQNGFDAINLRESDWTAGYVELFHKYGLRCLAWDAHLPRQIDRALSLGVDGIYSDYSDRMLSAVQNY